MLKAKQGRFWTALQIYHSWPVVPSNCCQYCQFPHTIANKLIGFLLFLTVPTISWCIIPIAIAAIIATFAAIQEGYYIGTRREII